MSSGLGRFIKPWEDIRSYLVSYGISKALPFGFSAMTFLVGLLQIPVAYSLATASVVFGLVSFGLFFFFQLAHQRSPEGKLVVLQPVFGMRRETVAGKTRVVGVKLGILMHNTSIFPMSYSVEVIQSAADGHISIDKNFVNKGGTIPPNIPWTFWDSEIVYQTATDRLTKLHVKATISYGRDKHLPFTMIHGFQGVCTLSDTENSNIEWFVDDQVFG